MMNGDTLMALLLGLIGGYLASYVREKGKNAATREDVAEITNKIEQIKLQHQLIIEQGNQRHQLKIAALDRRLEAHQQAYSLWREILHKTHKEREIGEHILKCQTWWENNCLYLQADAREAFFKAYTAANSHYGFVNDRNNPELVRENWAIITDAGTVIVRGVELPPIKEEDVIK